MLRRVDGIVMSGKYGPAMLDPGHTCFRELPVRVIDVELTVTDSRPVPAPPAGIAAVSRAVVSVAADLVTNVQRAVVGPANVRTARDNAFDAMLADRARNQARADLSREVAALVAARPARSRKIAKTPHIVRG
jgi:hypothetical protein